jgi:uncharacterized protein (TIGR02001 family)
MSLCALTAAAACADDTASESPHQFSANVLIATEYLYRGISQSNEDPALQGGFDYAHETTGFYVGFWASSIEFNAATSNTSSIETNFYGGFAGEFPIGVSWDIGGLYYYYPDTDEDVGADFNFVEVYGNLGYTFKTTLDPTVDVGFAYSPDFFGEDGDGLYLHGRLGFTLPYDFGVYTMFGYQDVDGDLTSGPAGYDYSHYAVGLTYEFGILTFDGSWNDASDDCGAGDICEALLFSVSSSW